MEPTNNNQINTNLAQPQVQPAVNPNAPQPQVKPKKSKLPLLLVLIVLLVIFGAATFFVNKNKAQNSLMQNKAWNSSTIHNANPNIQNVKKYQSTPSVSSTSSVEEKEVDAVSTNDDINADFQGVDRDLQELH